jgi:hypothetical protein
MIIKQKINSRDAAVQYLTAQLEPASEKTAELVKINFLDNGESLWLIPEKRATKLQTHESRDDLGLWS